MHTNTTSCPSCTEKLKAVHPSLVRWVKVLRDTHPDAHVSCGHRGEAAQEACFQAGTSKARFGESAHNVVPSMAVDLFRLTHAGGAAFDRPWFERVIGPIARAAGLVWGGDWKKFKDFPHVEMAEFKGAK